MFFFNVSKALIHFDAFLSTCSCASACESACSSDRTCSVSSTSCGACQMLHGQNKGDPWLWLLLKKKQSTFQHNQLKNYCILLSMDFLFILVFFCYKFPCIFLIQFCGCVLSDLWWDLDFAIYISGWIWLFTTYLSIKKLKIVYDLMFVLEHFEK